MYICGVADAYAGEEVGECHILNGEYTRMAVKGRLRLMSGSQSDKVSTDFPPPIELSQAVMGQIVHS